MRAPPSIELTPAQIDHLDAFWIRSGRCLANDWARGYMLGVELRRESWYRLMKDEESAGLILPVKALHVEHDDDFEFEGNSITIER